MRRSLLGGLLAATVLTGCSDGGKGPAAQITPTPITSSSSSAATYGRYDIGGGQTYGLTATADSIWATSFDAGTAVQINPETGTIAATVHVAGGATSILADGDSLWVAGYGAPGQPGKVSRIARGAVAASLAPGEVCCDLSIGGGLLWAVDPSGAVLAIDPANAKLAHRFTVPLDRNVHINAVYGGDSVWVASDTGPLYRMNPATGKTTTVDAGGGVPFVVEAGQLWGARTNALWAVDLATGKLARTIPLTNSIEVMALAVAGDDIWVGLRHPGRVGAVVRLAAANGGVRAETPVDIPARIIVAFGAAWVTDSGSSNVYRLAR